MLDTLFSTIFNDSTITLTGFFISIIVAIVLGAALALIYTFRSAYTKSFAVTLAMLPPIVSIIIMMVNGSLGAGVAVAGTFSLVRFRSAPGTAKEIGAIFLAMAVGLACGMGYPAFAVLFTLLMGAVSLIYTVTGFGENKAAQMQKLLQITVPEDLEYATVFDDIFEKYTTSAKLTRTKTTNLGSLNKLTYDIILKKPATEKQLIDELRCRNGNLEISCGVQYADNREL